MSAVTSDRVRLFILVREKGEGERGSSTATFDLQTTRTHPSSPLLISPAGALIKRKHSLGRGAIVQNQKTEPEQ